MTRTRGVSNLLVSLLLVAVGIALAVQAYHALSSQAAQASNVHLRPVIEYARVIYLGYGNDQLFYLLDISVSNPGPGTSAQFCIKALNVSEGGGFQYSTEEDITCVDTYLKPGAKVYEHVVQIPASTIQEICGVPTADCPLQKPFVVSIVVNDEEVASAFLSYEHP